MIGTNIIIKRINDHKKVGDLSENRLRGNERKRRRENHNGRDSHK